MYKAGQYAAVRALGLDKSAGLIPKLKPPKSQPPKSKLPSPEERLGQRPMTERFPQQATPYEFPEDVRAALERLNRPR